MRANQLRLVMENQVVSQRVFRFKAPVVRANLALEPPLLTVNGLVPPQSVDPSELFAAGFARVGLFARVRPHVNGKIFLEVEAFEANFALMLRFVVVLDVLVQTPFSFKVSIIRANVALEYSFITVSHLVFFQTQLGRKCFTASWAHWFVSWVSYQMSIKTSFTSKDLLTNFTPMRFIVDTHMIA